MTLCSWLDFVSQIASALAFLHMNKIIYRDLKPGNVLIFSLSLLSKVSPNPHDLPIHSFRLHVHPSFLYFSMCVCLQVNAKLSDYGIACYATESGLTQPMGTAGCKAPELLAANTSSMPYNDKVSPFLHTVTRVR